MKNKYIFTYSIGIFCSTLLFLFISGCTKTEYEQLKTPYTAIEYFRISGYGDLDSINGVIDGDTIYVYWSAEIEPPTSIAPLISVYEGATITPASGQSVAFSSSTEYTVTAEDGTIKKYVLKPVFNTAIPALFSLPTTYRWGQIDALSIVGQYFLASTDFSNIRVYAQRVSDGYEIDLDIDETTSSNTQLNVHFPDMTAEQDTGTHRIYVKVGDFASNYKELKMYQMSIVKDRIIASTSVAAPQNSVLKLGDTLTLTWNLDRVVPEQFARFYTKEKTNTSSVSLNLQAPSGGISLVQISSSDYNVEGNQIKIYLGNAFSNYVGRFIKQLSVSWYGNSVESGVSHAYHIYGGQQFKIHDASGAIPNDIIDTDTGFQSEFVQAGQEIAVGDALRLNYSFGTDALKTSYTGKVSSVELMFRNLVTTSSTLSGRYTNFNASIQTQAEGYVTFSIPSSYKNSIVGYGLEGIKLRFSDGSGRYLYADKLLPELNTKYVIR